jgi:DNA-binding LacI/PurR family transcriptional regulator
VRNDETAGASLAVGHLVDLGHQMIAHIDGGIGAGAAERRQGYQTAMKEQGLDSYATIVAGSFTEEGGYKGAESLLSSEQPPTAIFACNDFAAVGALRAVADAGLAVPRDVSVVGYDDSLLAHLPGMGLTTVLQPKEEMGRRAARLLIGRIEGDRGRARHLVLAPHLIVRDTSGPPIRRTSMIM